MTTADSTRTCRFPGCTEPAVASDEGVGRPPEYCADPAHTRGAAWRARRAARAAKEGRQVPDDLDRPVTMARARAGELINQLVNQVEQLSTALDRTVEELGTLGDPEAVAIQIEAVTTEADQKVAEAAARAARAERDQRTAELQRTEADAAAEEATERADQVAAQLQEAQETHRAAAEHWEQTATEQRAEIDRLTAALEAATTQAATSTARAETAEAAAAAAEARASTLDAELTTTTERLESTSQVATSSHPSERRTRNKPVRRWPPSWISSGPAPALPSKRPRPPAERPLACRRSCSAPSRSLSGSGTRSARRGRRCSRPGSGQPLRLPS